MEKAHRGILQRQLSNIVQDLNVDHVKHSLIQNDIFDTGHWEDIAKAGKGTRRDKASALMDELPRRGPRAFWCFCDSLMTGGYDFLGKPLIEEGKRITGERTARVREEYRKMLKKRKLSLLNALKKVAQSKKLRGRKASEQKLTSLKYIKDALESNSIDFEEPQISALNEMLALVDELKHIKDELERYGFVPESVKILSSMLAEGADFSTLYDDVIGSNYFSNFSLQWMTHGDTLKFGSVYVLIPYLCDISEQAVQKMDPQSFSNQGANSRRDENMKKEVLSLDTEEQDHTSDELDESGYMEGSSELTEPDGSSGRVSQQEDKLTLTDIKELFSVQFSAQREQIDQRLDKFKKDLDRKQRKDNEKIKANLRDVSRHLTDIKQALGRQEEMSDKVSELEERVRDLLIHEIDETTIKEEIEDIERQVVELKEQFQGGDQKIHDGLTQMNEQLGKMLLTLERDSLNEQELSEAIDTLKTELPLEYLQEFAKNLGFSEEEIIMIRISDSVDHKTQKAELFRMWRQQQGKKATVKALAKACRDTGLSTLADKISGMSSAPIDVREPLPPVQSTQGTPTSIRQTRPVGSKASGAKPKRKK